MAPLEMGKNNDIGLVCFGKNKFYVNFKKYTMTMGWMLA